MWKDLTQDQKAEVMDLYLSKGITSLSQIRDFYDSALQDNTFSDGGKIYIKPENRGKFTALKERTGHSSTWFKEHGTPAQKKMATFALNSRKWQHPDGGRIYIGGADQEVVVTPEQTFMQSIANRDPYVDYQFYSPTGNNIVQTINSTPRWQQYWADREASRVSNAMHQASPKVFDLLMSADAAARLPELALEIPEIYKAVKYGAQQGLRRISPTYDLYKTIGETTPKAEVPEPIYRIGRGINGVTYKPKTNDITFQEAVDNLSFIRARDAFAAKHGIIPEDVGLSRKALEEQAKDIISEANTFRRGVVYDSEMAAELGLNEEEFLEYAATHPWLNEERGLGTMWISPRTKGNYTSMYGKSFEIQRPYTLGNNSSKWFTEGDFDYHTAVPGYMVEEGKVYAPWRTSTEGTPLREETELLWTGTKPFTIKGRTSTIEPRITAENAANITPEQWTAAQDAAITISKTNPKLNKFEIPTLDFETLSKTIEHEIEQSQWKGLIRGEEDVFNYLGSEKHINRIMESGTPREKAVKIAQDMKLNAMATDRTIDYTGSGEKYMNIGEYDNGFFSNHRATFNPKYIVKKGLGEEDTYSTVIHELGGHGATMGYRPGSYSDINDMAAKWYEDAMTEWSPYHKDVYNHNSSLKPIRKPEYTNVKDSHIEYLEGVDEYSARARAANIDPSGNNRRDFSELYKYFTKESVDKLKEGVWSLAPLGLGLGATTITKR